LATAGFVRGMTSFAVVALVTHAGSDAVGGVVLVTGLLWAALLLALVRAVETVESERLGQAYVRALRRRLLETLLVTGPAGLTGFSRGSLWVRLTGDLTGLRRWIALGFARVIAAIPMLIVLVGSLSWLEPRLAILVVVAVAATALVARFQQTRLLAREAAVRRARARLAGSVDRLLSALAAPGHAEQAHAQLPGLKRRSTQVAEASVERAWSHAGVRATAEFAPLAVTACAYALLAGHDHAALLPALALAGLLGGPLRELALGWEMRQGYRIAAANVQRILDLWPSEIPHDPSAPVAPAVPASPPAPLKILPTSFLGSSTR
jgi:ABC-type multidrug transport system fused ATPase/permease subunit